jgi:hypothetical protein
MGHCRLTFGLLALVTIASSRGDDKPAKGPPSLQDDLKKLQGTWEPVKPIEQVGYLHLEFGRESKGDADYVAAIHAVDGGGMMLKVSNVVARFKLIDDNKKRVVSPVKKDDGVSSIVYRFDGDTLIVEEGECTVHHKVSLKGQWKRLKGEKVP